MECVFGRKIISSDALNSYIIGEAVNSANDAITIIQSEPAGEPVVISGEAWFLRADFERSGPDLNVHGPEGQQLLIRDYFLHETPPNLTTSDGVSLGAILLFA
tara:strand:- start:141 stop:449 length:309 start_codon:yes stop_codon:yes gene_type:complete